MFSLVELAVNKVEEDAMNDPAPHNEIAVAVNGLANGSLMCDAKIIVRTIPAATRL